jgi:hypothetical protein
MKKVFFLFATLVALSFVACSDDFNTPTPPPVSSTPRYLAAHDGKVYVSMHSGCVVRVDTISLAVDGVVAVGRNPEQLTVSGGNLYVANSGGLDYATPLGYDRTVSVVDLRSFKEKKKVEVAVNPTSIATAPDGEVYVVSSGNYTDVPVQLQKISPSLQAVTTIEGAAVSEMCVLGGSLFGLLSEYGENWSVTITYKHYDFASGTLSTSWITPGDEPVSPYKVFAAGDCVAVSSTDYVSSGSVALFNTDGTKTAEFEAGISPRKAVQVGENLYVLNEGLYGYNNSTITKYSLSTGQAEPGCAFSAANNLALGDTANDILFYGGKIYVAVATDNLLWVLSPDARVIEQIVF